MSQTTNAPFGNDLRAALVAMVRKRVPESEVEDIVQQALTEAIESPHAPKESEALRRWIFGVAKHKVVDYHRRAGRETFDMPDVAGNAAPHVEADLLRWAERNIPDSPENQKTLDWMLREGEGEKLESIAASEKLPAPRVRQRVSRLRRHLKDNWQREVALLAALGVVIGVLVFVFTKLKSGPEPITHDPNIVDPRAIEIRKNALQKCDASQWKECIDGLDEAKRLDPAGDTAPNVQKARDDASKALTAPPAPVPSTSDSSSRFDTPPPLDSAGPKPTAIPTVLSSAWRAAEPKSKESKEPGPNLAKPAPPSKSDSFGTPPVPATTPAPTVAPPSKAMKKPAAPTKGGGSDIDSIGTSAK